MEHSDRAFQIDKRLFEEPRLADLRLPQEKESQGSQGADGSQSLEDMAHAEDSAFEEERQPQKIRLVTIPKSELQHPWTRPKNSLYVEGTTIVVTGGVSLNYERFFNDNLGLRLSYQASYVFAIFAWASGHGPSLALVGAWGGKHAFELNGGLSFTVLTASSDVFSGAFTAGLDSTNSRRSYLVTPIVYAGYRFQADHGFLLRAGLGWTGGMAMGLSLSLGYAF